MGDKKYYFSLPLVGKLLKIKALLFLSSLRDMMENALLQGLHLNLIHPSFNKYLLKADTHQEQLWTLGLYQVTGQAELPTLPGLLGESRGPTISDASLQHRTFHADKDCGTRQARVQEGACGGCMVRVAVVARVI